MNNVSDTQVNDSFDIAYKEDLGTFESLLSSNKTSYSHTDHKILTGVVVDVMEKLGIAIVDLGLKGEAVVLLSEFVENAKKVDLKVGDTAEVYLKDYDTDELLISASRSRVRYEKVWNKLIESYKNGETIEGVIFSVVTGGFCVDIDGVLAFLPGSQVDIKMVKDIKPILNVRQPFKIISIDSNNKHGSRALAVSRRAVIEESRSENKLEFLGTIKEGDSLRGVVKNIANYGAFVDLGTMDGLLHIADITWDKISHPSEILSIGDVINVKVIKIDAEKRRISLGLKQLQENPWLYLRNKYSIGQKITGTVTNKADYGLFIEIEKGVEGLAHTTELDWTKEGCQSVLRSTSVGSQIDVTIMVLDVENHKISLSKKQSTENPWRMFIESRKVGDLIEGKVSDVTNYGIFISLDNGIKGLIHASDLSWDQYSSEDFSKYKQGQQIKAVYLSGDAESQRIALGIKQLTEDPFVKFESSLQVGSVITGTIVGSDNVNIIMTLFDNAIRTTIKKFHLSTDKYQDADKFAIGKKVDVKVIKFEKEKRNLVTSVRKLEEDRQKEILDQYGSTDSGATLGSILGENIEIPSSKNSKSNQDEE